MEGTTGCSTIQRTATTTTPSPSHHPITTLPTRLLPSPPAGGPDTVLPTVTLHYDFSAPRADDSIVSIEPCPLESKHDLPMKMYRRLTAAGPAAATAAAHRAHAR